ncbi:LamG-like jellyroll fold domain-containing protein [Paenibacillus oryzisoli]|uniref:LamG-like jellyroll fold domain-containing protein n=1 Tax=Paenibacillus oryzisoli TaxID=1850517 RepID=UPI003D283707
MLKRNFLIVCFALLLLTESYSFHVPPLKADTLNQTGTVDIQTLINTAITQGDSSVVIPSGTYRLGNTISIQNANNLTIFANDVNIVMTNLITAFQVTNSTNLTVQGLSVNYDPLPFTQGKVIATDPTTKSIDVQLDAGYPRGKYSRIEVYDPKTRFQKSRVPHYWDSTAVITGDVSHVTNVGSDIAIGDLVTLSSGTVPGISVGDSSGVTWKNVTLYTAPGSGYTDGGGQGGTHLDGFRIVRGPVPPGAEDPPLLTTVWDGIGIQNFAVGPIIENSTIENTGDDSFSIQSPGPIAVLKTDGNVIYIATNKALKTNMLLRQFNDGPEATALSSTLVKFDDVGIDNSLQAKITAAAGTNGLWDIGQLPVYRVQLDQTSPFQAGIFLFRPERMANGFIFRNNQITSPYRGMLLKANGGTIENNIFRGSNKAIVISPEGLSDSDAGVSNDVIIQNNQIINTGDHYFNAADEQAGAIVLTASNVKSDLAFSNITIENNTFDGVSGLNLNISDARNVTVQDNSFLNTHNAANGTNGTYLGIDPSTVIWVKHADTVTFLNNRIDKMGPNATIPIKIASGTSNITLNPGGIQVVKPNETTSYSIQNGSSGKVLGTLDNATADGTNIEQRTNTTALSQSWQFVNDGNGYYKIKNVNSGKFMGIKGGTTNDNTNILWSDNSTSNLLWQLIYIGEGYYNIQNKQSGQMLCMANTSTDDGALSTQCPASSSMSQNWRLSSLPLPPVVDSGTAYYKFDETTGVTVPDVSENKHDATLLSSLGGSTNWGTVGTLSFLHITPTGANTFGNYYASIPNFFDPAATDFSFTAWVKLEKSTDSGTTQTILSQDGATGRNILYRDASSGHLKTFLGGVMTTTTDVVPIDTWTHVALVKHGSNIKLFINGALDSTALVTAESSTGDFRLGAHKSPSIGNANWNGSIDEVQITESALTDDQIQNICNGTAPMAYYRMNESSGSTVSDLSGNHHSASLVTSSVGTLNWVGGALDFVPTGASFGNYYASIPNLFDSAATEFTISAWVKLDQASASGTNQMIITQEGDGGRSLLYRDGTTGTLRSFFGGVTTSSTKVIPTGVWTQIALVKKGGTIQLYINGLADGTASVTAESSTGNLRLGAANAPTYYFQNWNGSIDEVQIFKAALTSDEVIHTYNGVTP